MDGHDKIVVAVVFISTAVSVGLTLYGIMYGK
jgi:hypothetical protein